MSSLLTRCGQPELVLEVGPTGLLVPACRHCGWRGQPSSDHVAGEALLGSHCDRRELEEGQVYLDIATGTVRVLTVPAEEPLRPLRLRLRRRVYEAIALHAKGNRAGWVRECVAIRRDFPKDEITAALTVIRRHDHPLLPELPSATSTGEVAR